MWRKSFPKTIVILILAVFMVFPSGMAFAQSGSPIITMVQNIKGYQGEDISDAPNYGSYYALPTHDQGAVLIGNAQEIVKVDREGNKQWKQQLFLSWYHEIMDEKDLGIVVGMVKYAEVTDTDDVIIIAQLKALLHEEKPKLLAAKISSTGKLVWKHEWVNEMKDIRLESVQRMADGAYSMLVTRDPDDSHATRSLIILGPAGELKSETELKQGTFQHVQLMKPTTDGGWLLLGTVEDPKKKEQMYFAKMDRSLHLLWEKTYGADGNDEPTDVISTGDGGYLITGTKNFSKGPFEFFGPVGNDDLYAIKTDSEGAVLWEKSYGTSAEMGRTAVQTKDGGFLLIGFYRGWSRGIALEVPIRYGYVVKIDRSGNQQWTKRTDYEILAVQDDGADSYDFNLIGIEPYIGRAAGDDAFVNIHIRKEPKNMPAREPVGVIVNEKFVTFDVPPKLVWGTTMVPVKAIADMLGVQVEWIGKTKKVIIRKQDQVIELQIGRAEAIVNGGQVIGIGVAPEIMQRRTLVPVRIISQYFGANVFWDADARNVVITGGNEVADT